MNFYSEHIEMKNRLDQPFGLELQIEQGWTISNQFLKIHT